MATHREQALPRASNDPGTGDTSRNRDAWTRAVLSDSRKGGRRSVEQVPSCESVGRPVCLAVKKRRTSRLGSRRFGVLRRLVTTLTQAASRAKEPAVFHLGRWNAPA